MGDYTFGDTDLAAERLRILDAVFAPTTDALLDDLVVRPSRVADLGCGPGATTARLSRRFPSATIATFLGSCSSTPAGTSSASSHLVRRRLQVFGRCHPSVIA
jgi:Trans-aconitate methyltransferase